MSTKTYSRLFQPIKIGNMEIKNRIAMAPMGIAGLVTENGGFTQRAIDYYAERAKGETGLIITGVVKVENEIDKLHVLTIPCLTLDPRHFIQTASNLTQAVHAYDAKIIVQLTAGLGRVGAPPRGMPESQAIPVAPSAIPNYWDPTITCRELTTREVETLVQRFGEAAEVMVTAGFDGIEIHAVHEGYLLDQFTIAMFNKRTDKYGGDLKGRLTLPIEILHEIKNKVGKDYPVQLRFSIKSFVKDWRQGGLPNEEFKEAGRDTEEGLEAARILEKAGYDAFNADAGTYDAWYWAHPPLYQEHGCYLPLTEKLKKVVKVPVIVAGRMELPELAEQAIVEGKIDIVELGRGLLADPFWANKVKEGKTDNIRPCLGCHDGCVGSMFLNRALSCAVNPACGREIEYAVQPTSQTKNVIVVGGGVAGMEAARVAAIRGHRVTLYEKSAKLGGHLIEASVPSFKKDVERLIDWYKNELDALKIQIHLNKVVSPELLQEKNPDAVIVATGSRPIIPDIPGIEKERITTATDLLLNKKRGGESVIIAGGGLIGCETALWLAQQGKKVTIVEALDRLMQAGNPVPRPNKLMLLDLLRFYKVTVLTNTTLIEITDEGAIVEDTSSRRNTLPADTVVLAVGLECDQNLYQSLTGKIANLYLIGDAMQAQNIMHAIWNAYEVTRNI